jgi:four helix bundle protein
MTHKDLNVWKNGIEMVTEIYKITESFPHTEMYGLTNQIRRCAVSIPSNIAEGAGRFYKKEFIQFLFISLGSLSELETQLIIANNLNFLHKNAFSEFDNKMKIIRQQLLGLVKSLRKNAQ